MKHPLHPSLRVGRQIQESDWLKRDIGTGKSVPSESPVKQARVSSWHPHSDLPRPSGGEKETRKIRMATTLGAEKKRSGSTKGEEKMTNAPVRTAASEPSQHTTETKKVELNKLYSNTGYVFN